MWPCDYDRYFNLLDGCALPSCTSFSFMVLHLHTKMYEHALHHLEFLTFIKASHKISTLSLLFSNRYVYYFTISIDNILINISAHRTLPEKLIPCLFISYLFLSRGSKFFESFQKSLILFSQERERDLPTGSCKLSARFEYLTNCRCKIDARKWGFRV